MADLSKEQLFLLNHFNATDASYPERICLAQLFEEQCDKTPNAIAVEFNGMQLTYEQLNSKTNQVAAFLLKQGIQPDQMVGLCSERSFDLVIGVLGILKAGAAYVPFDPSYPTDRIEYMLKESGIKTVLLQEQYRNIFKSEGIITKALDSEWNDFDKESNANPSVKQFPDHLAYVLFTSGSTGMPKGVGMVQKALMNLIAWQKNSTNLGVAARTLQFAPISFDVSFQELFTTWTTGGTLILISDEMRLNAIRLLEFIQENNIQRLFLPFIALQHLAEVADNSKIWPLGLKDVVTAGEQLQITKHIASFFTHLPNCKLHNHYGPTETHVVTALTLGGTPETWLSLPPIGKPIANTHVYLLGADMLPVDHGKQGEIYIAGIALARGYINRDELTKERFILNPFEESGNLRIYKTGDIGRYLHDGNIEYLGRVDNQVKVRGYRIELGEIEVALSKHPAVTQVAVTVREDEPGDKRLVAYLVFDGNKKITTGEIRKFISDKLPEYMLPSSFVFLKTLPKTPSGKIDRKSLPKPEESRPDIGTAFNAPQSLEEKIIAKLWCSLLHIESVGIDDNFFELGGNSLLALQTIARLRQEHGMDVPVVKMYQFPTIKGLLNSLSDSSNKKSSFDKAKERQLKHTSHQKQNKSVEDGIAIVGMSGRFPGAKNVEQMWNNLLEGKETTKFFTLDEIDSFIDPSIIIDPSYVKARGVIDDADKFDAAFFGVNPRLAELMDPQQRIFLEVCWEALENAGYTSAGYDGLIGVYSGMGNNTYYTNNVIGHKDAIEKVGGFQVMVANEKDYIATRISHFMNLTGPGLSVHTACSTSLTAVAMACQSLWNNQCDMAIAGGIAITSPVNSGHLYQEGGMFSEDGHTRSFDDDARGTVFSDGTGVIVLKKYRDAVADGDAIYAVVRGVGINNDGAEKASFTAPSVQGQADVIAMAQADANVSPDSISYIETHGTATPLGDPIEVEALTQAFRGGTDKIGFCAIGSVKSNFGHLTAAAGVAGLIKTALSLKNKILPASINFSKPNTRIDFANSPFYVNTKLAEWNCDGPRRAGVSSFGVGGTNVHLIVEEAPLQSPSGISRSKHLLLLSAKGAENLETATTNLKNYFNSHPESDIADAAYTLQTGRVAFSNRKLVVCDSIQDAIQQLQEKSPVKTASRSLETVSGGVAFMFPGQGSQYVNMGSNLYRDEIVFREAVDRCAEILISHLGLDIRTILYPAKEGEEDAAKKLQETCYTQPALFTVGYALAKLWMNWGILPAALIGHSIGEFAAACISGVMSLEDALMLVANRGKMMQSLPKGSMISVRKSSDDIAKLLTPDLSIAAINGPSLCVVSGNDIAIENLQKILDSKEIINKKLFTSHAFHSPMMDPIVEPFRELVSSIKLNAPKIPIVSTATSQWLTNEQAVDPGYWSRHLRLGVLFADGIKTIWQKNPTFFLLEMGPRNTAATLAKQQATDLKKQQAVPSLPDNSQDDAEWGTMLFAIGQLWLSGISIDWKNFYALENRKHIALPTYPFEKKRFWVDPVNTAAPLNTFHPYNPFAENALLPINDLQNNSENTSNLILTDMNIPSRKERIIAELKNVMEEASGIELASADADSTFMELGMDSLFLTQAALTISKKYGVKVTFRQLNESISSMGSLASHLDQTLPADALPAPVATPSINNAGQSVPNRMHIPAQPTANNAAPGSMQWLITQQLQVMQQQLAMMGGMNSSTTAPIQVQQNIPPQPVADNNLNTKNSSVKAGLAEVSENEKAELSKPFGAIARIEKASSTELTDNQKKWISEFTKRYNSKTTKSKTYTQFHRPHLADPRVVTGFKPTIKELIYQVVVDRSKGSRLWDIDGNEYLDVLNGFGSNFLGYNSPIIIKAVEEQLKNGIELGPQHPLAGEVAKLLCDFTGYDRAGFCNTGSEAVLGAMRIARTVTGRSTIVCFNGSYHGINDEVIVRGTKKLKSFPASAGIMPEAVENMLVLDYGTDEALEIIRERAGEIAAVMVEPIQSRRADFKPKAFLQEVRKITAANECLLIFDEVITGFRLLPGGAQSFYDIKADLGTYGKVIGGGMPIGVIAGKKEYMDALDGGQWQFGDTSVPEVGVTYFAGTFVRHPLALAAAKAVLIHLKERGMEIYDKLNGYANRFVEAVNANASKTGAPYHMVNFGSLFKMKWDVEQPFGELIFLLLRDKGIHIYDGFPCFFTDAFTDADVDNLIAKFIEVTSELQAVGFLPSQSNVNEPTSNGLLTGGKSHDGPPIPGAKAGKDADGNPGWFVADPQKPGKYMQVFKS